MMGYTKKLVYKSAKLSANVLTIYCQHDYFSERYHCRGIPVWRDIAVQLQATESQSIDLARRDSGKPSLPASLNEIPLHVADQLERLSWSK
jgi:hypothetical protein